MHGQYQNACISKTYKLNGFIVLELVIKLTNSSAF